MKTAATQSAGAWTSTEYMGSIKRGEAWSESVRDVCQNKWEEEEKAQDKTNHEKGRVAHSSSGGDDLTASSEDGLRCNRGVEDTELDVSHRFDTKIG